MKRVASAFLSDTLLARYVGEKSVVTRPPPRTRNCRSGTWVAPDRFTGETSTTMSVEPGIIDTNVLVYAMDADAPQHAAARVLLEAARNPSATLYVTSQILCEFYSVVTNTRRVPRPRTPDQALRAISSLLTFLHVLPTPARAVEGWLDLLRRRPVTGGDVFDLQSRRRYAGAWNFQDLPHLTAATFGRSMS